MDEWPAIKSPAEFTGKGFERIGDPNEERGQGSLWFRDGEFDGMQYPSREKAGQWNPETAASWGKAWRRMEAERLALEWRDNPTSPEIKAAIKRIRRECLDAKPQEKATAAAIGRIKRGEMPSFWPAQNRRERASILSLTQLAGELHRPPTESEVIDRMLRLEDSTSPSGENLTLDGDRKNLAGFLRSYGFAWLERRARGFQGER